MKRRFDTENERRDYFRVDDTARVCFRLRDPHLPLQEDTAYQQRKKQFGLKARLDHLTREMQPVHKMIAAKNGKVARYLAMIDEKLDLIADSLVINEADVDGCAGEVNIGAGGIAFDSPRAVMAGNMLEMEIVLLPEQCVIFSAAKVIACNKQEQDGEARYRIAVEFVDMDDDVRDQISRHVIKREIAHVAGE